MCHVTQPNESSKLGEKALVAIGSNATSRHGTPRETVEAAIAALDTGPTHVVRASRLYLTPFVPAGREPDVVNAVVLVETALEPRDLLARLHEIEAAFDRARGERWTSRTLDLDIVAMGERVLPDAATLEGWIGLPLEEQMQRAPDQLILPHPRLQDRSFVLVPAADVAPDWRHPVSGLTIREMRDARPSEEVDAVRPLAP